MYNIMVIMRSSRSYRKEKVRLAKVKEVTSIVTIKFKCINFILNNHLYSDFKNWCVEKGYFVNGCFIKNQNKCAYLYLSTHHYLEDFRACIIAGVSSYSELFSLVQRSYL